MSGVTDIIKGIKDPAGIAQVGLGVAQAASGIIKERKAEKHMPSDVDPGLEKHKDMVSRRLRRAESGTGIDSMSKNILSGRKSGMNRAFKSGFGFMEGMNKSSQMTNQALLTLNAQNDQKSNALLNILTNLEEKKAQRKIELDLFKHDNLKAQAKENKTSGLENIITGIVNSGTFDQGDQEEEINASSV